MFVDQVHADIFYCVCHMHHKEVTGVFLWLETCHPGKGCRCWLSVCQSACPGPDCWAIKSETTLLYVSSVHVDALNGARIAYKCVRLKSEWSLYSCYSLLSLLHIHHPVICFILDNVSHCSSAGGSIVAMCIYMYCNPEGPRFDPWNSQPVCACLCVSAWKAPCPWIWHKSPTTIPARTG